MSLSYSNPNISLGVKINSLQFKVLDNLPCWYTRCAIFSRSLHLFFPTYIADAHPIIHLRAHTASGYMDSRSVPQTLEFLWPCNSTQPIQGGAKGILIQSWKIVPQVPHTQVTLFSVAFFTISPMYPVESNLSCLQG